MIEEDLIEVSSSSLCARGGRRPCPWHRTRVPGAAFGSGGDEDARLVSRASKVNASRPEPVRRVTCWFVKSAVSSRVVRWNVAFVVSGAPRALRRRGRGRSAAPAGAAHTFSSRFSRARERFDDDDDCDSRTTTTISRRDRRHEVARPLQPEPHLFESLFTRARAQSGRHRERFDDTASDSTTTTSDSTTTTTISRRDRRRRRFRRRPSISARLRGFFLGKKSSRAAMCPARAPQREFRGHERRVVRAPVRLRMRLYRRLYATRARRGPRVERLARRRRRGDGRVGRVHFRERGVRSTRAVAAGGVDG